MIAHMPLLALALLLPAAAHDDNVEWNGVSHIDWLERSPICPIDGESFTVAFQTYHYDIESANVHVSSNGLPLWVVGADFSHQRGSYDVWTATIPDSSVFGTTLEYYIELIDGSDNDYLGPPGLGANGMSDTPPASGWTLDFVTNSHAPLGATLTSDGGAVFGVWAPGVDPATLRGDFNGWAEEPMVAVGEHRFVHVPDVIAADEYKFYFNDVHWQEDARYRTVNRDAPYNFNSVIVDPTAYVWGDDGFTIPPFEEMVIYELHVGTFSGLNDGLNRMGLYRDVVDTHLDDLLYLGVNVVELMPITEFNYYESWGYNPVNNWAPEEAYGSPDDLKYMIDVLHRNGIAVLLDVVYNHFATEGNYLWGYEASDWSKIYFDVTGGSPDCDPGWGAQAAFWKQGVRDYYEQNVLFWLEEYHVDGFRMDATKFMRPPDGCYDPEGWDIMQNINNSIDARKLNAISIAEELPDDGWATKVTSENGAGFDSQWHDEYKYAIRSAVFAAAGGTPDMGRLAAAIAGQLNDGMGYITDWGQTLTQVVNYIESHDEGGKVDETGERLAVSIDSGDHYSKWVKGRSKLAQGLTILAPGIPIFLQGGEWLEDIQFGCSWDYRIDWGKAVSRSAIVLFFRDVIKVRKSNCTVRSDAGFSVYHLNDADDVIAFTRGDDQELVVVASLHNSDLNNYRIGFPAHGTWYEILNSQAGDYLGNGSGNGGSIYTDEDYTHNGLPHSAEITVPEMGLLVFRYEDPLGRDADLDDDGHVDLFDYYILQQRVGDAGCGMDADLDEDGRVDRADVAVLVDSLTGPS